MISYMLHAPKKNKADSLISNYCSPFLNKEPNLSTFSYSFLPPEFHVNSAVLYMYSARFHDQLKNSLFQVFVVDLERQWTSTDQYNSSNGPHMLWMEGVFVFLIHSFKQNLHAFCLSIIFIIHCVFTYSTILAIAGDDFSVIASDTRLSEGFQVYTRDQPKTYQLYVNGQICYACDYWGFNCTHKVLINEGAWCMHFVPFDCALNKIAFFQ